MYTQCPHCGIVFRITPGQLRVASGKVRCGGCSTVFNALETLSEDPAGISTDYARARPGGADSGPPRDYVEKATEAQKGGAGSEARRPPPADDDEELAARLDRLLVSAADVPDQETTDTDEARAATKVIIDPSVEVADELAETEVDYRSRSATVFADDLETMPHRRRSGLWITASVLLVVALIGQLLWFGRNQLLSDPAIRGIALSISNTLGVELPPVQDPTKFELISRDILPHASRPDTLVAKIRFRNLAAVPIALPKLELTLFDRSGRVAGQRKFGADEYLAAERPKALAPSQSIDVEMELVDPGEEVTGFQIDFF